MKVYEWTGQTGVHFRDVCQPSGTYYRNITPSEVIRLLEAAWESQARVRLYYGDRKTGRDWGDTCGVYGRIGRSTGPIKVLILLAQRRSTGGGEILCDCIVRLKVNGKEVYRHPKYHKELPF